MIRVVDLKEEEEAEEVRSLEEISKNQLGNLKI
jgi:hypothetical protein